MNKLLILVILSVFLANGCGISDDAGISSGQAVTSDPGCTDGDCPPDPGCTDGDCPPDPGCTDGDCPPDPGCTDGDCPPDPGCTDGDCPPDPGCTDGDCPPDPDPDPNPDYYADCCCTDVGQDNLRVCCCKEKDVVNCRLSETMSDGSHTQVADVSMTGTKPKFCKFMLKKVCKQKFKKVCWNNNKGKKVCKKSLKKVCKFLKKKICRYHFCAPDWFPTDVVWAKGTGCNWWYQIHQCPAYFTP